MVLGRAYFFSEAAWVFRLEMHNSGGFYIGPTGCYFSPGYLSVGIVVREFGHLAYVVFVATGKEAGTFVAAAKKDFLLLRACRGESDD